MQEFIYYTPNGLEFPLSESICVSTSNSTQTNNNFLVSNSKEVQAEFVAKEIDFYIKNSQDELSAKIKNVEKLYELNAIRYDLSKDISFTQEVNNQLLIVGTLEQKEQFFQEINSDEFDLYYVDPELVLNIKGHIGNLKVTVNAEGKEVILNVSQVVWFDMAEMGLQQSGCFDPLQTTVEQTVEILRANISEYTYKKFTTYDSTVCQYHERREEICGKCEEVCPTVAIVKDDKNKHLVFSQIDCHGCGGCISVCPSGALDYAPTSRDSMFEMSRFYEGHIALVVPEKMDIEHLEIPLKQNVLPFLIEGEKFLHEQSLLTLLQESGSQVVFYTDFLSKGTKDSIHILNQIYQKKYGTDAILLAMNQDELRTSLEQVRTIPNSRFTFNHGTSRKREIFSIRLQHIVKEEDLGVIITGEHIHYGLVKVKEVNCTLCLACVGACNVDALVADARDNTLRIIPSLCTACGYCEVSCPEKDCLTIEQDIIQLNPTWFQENVLAQDELYPCIECGKEFATKKAIEKIAAMMGPIFAKMSKTKERTLYCCEDCKAKIMIKEGMLNAY
ncbi:MAG: 4Fe-4S binding protein [Arcobacteraceae bacterium]